MKALREAKTLFKQSDYRPGIEKTSFLTTTLGIPKNPSEFCATPRKVKNPKSTGLPRSPLSPIILSGDRQRVSKILEKMSRSAFEELPPPEQKKLIAAAIIYGFDTHNNRFQRFYQQMGQPFPPCDVSTQ